MKDGLIKLLRWVIRKLNVLYRILAKNKLSDSPLVSLAPQVNLQESPEFLKCLADALENKNIKNIAVSGMYGSGKSTFLKTFEHFHQEYSYLNISLASFNSYKEVKKDSENNTSELKHDNLLEKSILQQMIYHVKDNTLPDSRLKKIIHMSKCKVCFRSFYIIAWLLSTFMLVRFKLWEGLKAYKAYEANYDNILSKGWLTTLYFIILAGFILGLLYLVCFMTRLLNNAQFSKLNLKTLEIKLFDDKTPSVLNHHIDEILYFFEATKFDVVIFEDLDRFNNTNIFVKLRELNILINKSEQIGRDITFIYAIKDDMFTDEKRTKFFDFIIPIIPVITSSNSKEKLIERFEQLKLIDNDLTKEFLSDISLYISDMRILNNIINEFIIYKQRIGDNISLLKTNRLFSIVVYKNIYPSDFAELHKNKGFVYNTITNKSNLASKFVENKQKDANGLKKRLENTKEEILNSTFELRSVYIQRLLKILPDNASVVKINTSFFPIKKLVEDSVFNVFRTTPISEYHTQRSGSYASQRHNKSISFQDVEKDLNPHIRYDNREKIMIDKQKSNVNNLKIQLAKLEDEIRAIKSFPLSELINKFHFEWDTEIKNYSLIRFLIRNGYINEDYKDYISYFYPGTLSANDKEFVISVKDHSHLDYHFCLDNLEEVIAEIQDYEFSQEEVLNFDLMNFLLTNKNNYNNQLNTIFKQLSNKKKSSIEFIDRFIFGKSANLGEFTTKLCSAWKGFWYYISIDSTYDDDKVYSYLKLIISHGNIYDIIAMDIERCLFNYIVNRGDFLVLQLDASILKEIISKLDIKFVTIDENNHSEDLLKYVYEGNYYHLNKNMIELMLKKFNTSKDCNLDNLNTANYTTIMHSDCDILKSYIKGNISNYLAYTFSKIETNSEESEETVISLLNNEDINNDDKLLIIEEGNTIISNLKDIDQQSLWENIINNNKCILNWDNVVAYYTVVGSLDECIMQIFSNNDACNKLSSERLNKEDKTVKPLCGEIILSNEIADECYNLLMSSIPYIYNSIDIKDISFNKAAILVDKGILNLTVSNYNLLREHFGVHHITLLKKWFQKFLEAEDFSKYTFDADDYCELLTADEISLNQKDQLIQRFPLNTYSNNSDLANIVGEIIVQVRDNIDYDLIVTLINNGHSIEMKLKMLIHQFDVLSNDQITNILKKIGGDYSEITIKHTVPRFPNNDINRTLVEKLKNRGYISPRSRLTAKGDIKVVTFYK